MNAAVRAVTRMGIYVGAKVFLIYEVRRRAGPLAPTPPLKGAVHGGEGLGHLATGRGLESREADVGAG